MTPAPALRNSVLQALELVIGTCPAANLTQVLAFLYVAENQGCSVSELAVLLRTTRATASRTVKALAAGRGRLATRETQGLIEAVPDERGGYKALVLTVRGRVLANAIDASIRRTVCIQAP